MKHLRFVVKYVATSDCFVHLSAAWLRRLETEEKVIEVLHKGKAYYFSCIPRVNNDETICIGAIFAQSLKILEGEEVFVSSVKHVPVLNRIDIVPHTASDRELLEMQAEKVQSSLLSQVRVVAKEQPIVARISKYSVVTFTTAHLEPKSLYGLLEEFTEMHVCDAKTTKNIDEEVAVQLRDSMAKIFPYVPKKEDNRDSQKNAANYALLQSFRKKSRPSLFRVHPLPAFQSFEPSNPGDMIMQCPFYILISENDMPKGSTKGTMCKVKKVPENRQHVDDTSTNVRRDDPLFPGSPEEITARIYILEDIIKTCSTSLDKTYFYLNPSHTCAYVSDSLMITLKLQVGSKIVVRTIEEDESPKPTSMDIFPYDQSMTAELFDDYVKLFSTHEPLLLNSCSTIILPNGRQCVLRISPANCDHVTIDYKDMKDLVVHVRSALNSSDAYTLEYHSFLQDVKKWDKIFPSWMPDLLERCEVPLDLSLGCRRPTGFLYNRENILLHGDLGSGKTTICEILIERYRNSPCFAYTHMISCKSLQGKKVEMLRKIVMTAMNKCMYYQPSILFLDDLESITNASLNDEENTIDATNAARITDMLINTVNQYQKYHYISIFATCISVNKISAQLRPKRGAQFFKTLVSIPSLDEVDRINILRSTLEDNLCTPGDVKWNYYGNKTEGWMVQDLVDLAEKAKFVAWKRHGTGNSKPPIIVTEEDVNSALSNTTPMSMQGVQLYKSDGHSWSNVGGLTSTKNALAEILQWPLKYPEFFKNAPIKLQSGVLLYGMPGTGKTMLAKAIAGECGVNLISIKGPELLSKYIGVSEESVRNVFERARRAKPCVLFFDEFDSLAPRRGHDSTGVTDRVVNQLLTQLDGIEDREGVAIVAASSRPDLLDPALLRPGRLDKCLHCPLPNKADRRAIFAALCESQNIDKSKLNLKELAQLTDGFTGADINAVITQARMSAYKIFETVDNVDITTVRIAAADIQVTQTQLVESVKSTRPSLSAAEKLKYTEIYARFCKKDSIVEEVLKNQKATLA